MGRETRVDPGSEAREETVVGEVQPEGTERTVETVMLHQLQESDFHRDLCRLGLMPPCKHRDWIVLKPAQGGIRQSSPGYVQEIDKY
jgi:hypothetical protein